MRLRKLLLAAVLSGTPLAILTAQAGLPSPQQVLDRYVAAAGGRAALERRTSRSITRKLVVQGGGARLEIHEPAAQPSSQGTPAPAQIPAPGKSLVPDTFTNLQVLPKDIAKKDLVAIMKGLCRTTKQRCSFCHVATDDLSEADFPSDEKETKKNARELLRMILDTQKAAAKP